MPNLVVRSGLAAVSFPISLPADQQEFRRSADIADEQLDRVRIPLDTAVIFATAKVGTRPYRYSRNCEGLRQQEHMAYVEAAAGRGHAA